MMKKKEKSMNVEKEFCKVLDQKKSNKRKLFGSTHLVIQWGKSSIVLYVVGEKRRLASMGLSCACSLYLVFLICCIMVIEKYFSVTTASTRYY